MVSCDLGSSVVSHFFARNRTAAVSSIVDAPFDPSQSSRKSASLSTMMLTSILRRGDTRRYLSSVVVNPLEKLVNESLSRGLCDSEGNKRPKAHWTMSLAIGVPNQVGGASMFSSSMLHPSFAHLPHITSSSFRRLPICEPSVSNVSPQTASTLSLRRMQNFRPRRFLHPFCSSTVNSDREKKSANGEPKGIAKPFHWSRYCPLSPCIRSQVLSLRCGLETGEKTRAT